MAKNAQKKKWENKNNRRVGGIKYRWGRGPSKYFETAKKLFNSKANGKDSEILFIK